MVNRYSLVDIQSKKEEKQKPVLTFGVVMELYPYSLPVSLYSTCEMVKTTLHRCAKTSNLHNGKLLTNPEA